MAYEAERDEPLRSPAQREAGSPLREAPRPAATDATGAPAAASPANPPASSVPASSAPPPSVPPPSVPPADAVREGPASEPPSGEREGRRGRFESILPGLIRRGIEKGIEAGLNTLDRSIETGRETTDAVREVFSEVRTPRNVANAVGRALQEARLPREIASAVFNQFDETKNDVLRIVAREVRDFLDATDIASELKAALTSLSFEVRTEVRFIPNEAGTGVRPDVRARTRIKRGQRDSRRERNRRHARTKRGRL
jgi:hypothetical protein